MRAWTRQMLAAAGIGTLSLMAAATGEAAPIIIDSSDATGFIKQGDGFYGEQTAPDGRAYKNNFRFAGSGTGGNAFAGWDFTGLTAGTYNVYVTWAVDRQLSPFWSNDCMAAPFTVIDGGIVAGGYPLYLPMGPVTGASVLETVVVNQRQNAAGYSYDGANWLKLGSYTITGSQLSVILSNNTASSGSVLADAVMVEAVPEPTSVALLALAASGVMRRVRLAQPR